VCDVCATCVRRVSDETVTTSHAPRSHTANSSDSKASKPDVLLMKKVSMINEGRGLMVDF
jgi:hypothetical protein